jgi:Peptidase A4 family
MRKTLMLVTVAVAALALPTLSLAAPAGASSAPPPVGHVVTYGNARAMPSVHLAPTHLPHPVVRNATYITNNWAGYAVTSRGGLTIPQVNDTFIVPNVNCATTPIGTYGATYVAVWAGFDGLIAASNTVEQEGVDAYCTSQSASPVYYDWYEMYPLDPVVEGTVTPGDAISAESLRSGSDYILSLDDLTSDSGFTTTQTCPSGSTCLDNTAEVITEDPGGAAPAGVNLANFAQDQQMEILAHNQAGQRGAFVTCPSWTSQTVDMVDPDDVPMATPGPNYGEAFYVSWENGS